MTSDVPLSFFLLNAVVRGQRQLTRTCERGVPSVGCTDPQAATSDTLVLAGMRQRPGKVYGGKAAELSRRM